MNYERLIPAIVVLSMIVVMIISIYQVATNFVNSINSVQNSVPNISNLLPSPLDFLMLLLGTLATAVGITIVKWLIDNHLNRGQQAPQPVGPACPLPQPNTGGGGQFPSRPTFPTQPLPSLQNWDPKVWVGRRLDVYKVTEVLGEGGMSYVLKGEFDNGVVAIKVLKVFGGKAEEYFDELFKEASNLITLSKNPNIVQVFAVSVNKQVIEGILNGRTRLYLTNPPMIVMEFMEGGSLYSLLKDDAFFYSTTWQKAVYKAIASIAEALTYVHANGYVHMDVKPENVLMDRKPSQPSDLFSVKYKLGDLGSAIRVGSNPIQLTIEYAPPESLTQTAKPYMDVFALGMTLYVLLTRKNDRPDLQEMNDAFDCLVRSDTNCVTRKAMEAKAKLATWDPSVNPEIDPLLRKMLSPDPSQRPTAKEVADYLKRLY